jgi:bifunctional enzyme Fae/Hps
MNTKYRKTFEAFSDKLRAHTRYLHIALNHTLEEALRIASQIPVSDKIILEAGTPLIKRYGTSAISSLKGIRPDLYVIADLKCADLSEKEAMLAYQAGADAVTAVGTAPIATLNAFIALCHQYQMDSLIDMMNITDPIRVLRRLPNLPTIVMLHRGVDETENNKEKLIPYYQIKQIKGNYNSILVDVGGGDTPREIQSAVFNDADIVMVWKAFYENPQEIASIAKKFLEIIR